MINNPDKIQNKFKANKTLAHYLIYTGHIPVLAIDENFTYFAKTTELREVLSKLPIWLKIAKIF